MSDGSALSVWSAAETLAPPHVRAARWVAAERLVPHKARPALRCRDAEPARAPPKPRELGRQGSAGSRAVVLPTRRSVCIGCDWRAPMSTGAVGAVYGRPSSLGMASVIPAAVCGRRGDGAAILLVISGVPANVVIGYADGGTGDGDGGRELNNSCSSHAGETDAGRGGRGMSSEAEPLASASPGAASRTTIFRKIILSSTD